jgi:hypothetical protein
MTTNANGTDTRNMAAPQRKQAGLLSRLGLKKQNKVYSRRHSRHECCIISNMIVVDRGIELEGLVLEISQGGALFRHASAYILDRSGETVTLRMSDVKASGTIMNVRPTGYGIRFAQELDPASMDRLLAAYGFQE